MNDYDRIARVIGYLDENFREQPDLDELARVAGLSPHHFHRLFVRWAGTTPKSFLQWLTLAAVRERLRAGESILDAALDVGLSGPGRLHDLCVRLESASPGEIKSGGAGWDLQVGVADSPFGSMMTAVGPRGICWLSFLGAEEDRESEWGRIQEDWPGARLTPNDALAAALARRIFSSASSEPFTVLVKGSEFQKKVWQALIRIPSGSLLSYGALARSLGTPDAARAVGSAVASNSVAVLIPCHRVIRASGILGGYRWNPVRKRVLTAWEAVRACKETAVSADP